MIHRQSTQPRVSVYFIANRHYYARREVVMTVLRTCYYVLRLLLYPGNANLKNSHGQHPTEQAMCCICFHCINVSYSVSVCKDKLPFLLHPQRTKFAFPFSIHSKIPTVASQGLVLLFLLWLVLLPSFLLWKITPPTPANNKMIFSAGCSFQVLVDNQQCPWDASFRNIKKHQT